jgi:NAD(P)-dependent dehydrogenase (short-subunit alcohol dehydrogenase family)
MPWTENDIPDLGGRVALVTGANTGIGFETARALAAAGATVVLACRDPVRAAAAVDRLRDEIPAAALCMVRLDLAALASVRAAADRVRAEHARLDLLIANAGVLTPPPGHTEDGFELHVGINHLGHFALTGLLLDPLLAAPAARVVVVSSLSARWTRGVGDLGSAPRRGGLAAYGRSKLANLVFAQELDRRFRAAGARAVAVAAHPGGSSTEVARHHPVLRRMRGTPLRRLAHPPAAAALPVLRAAVDPAVAGGDYCGPDGRLGLTGAPVRLPVPRAARDPDLGRQLWAESERLTGVSFAIR